MGKLADFHHTKMLVRSVLIGIIGFVKEYWQLLLTRFGAAIGKVLLLGISTITKFTLTK